MDNFLDLMVLMGNSWVPLSRYFANTLLITIIGTAGHILLASAQPIRWPNTGFRLKGAVFHCGARLDVFAPCYGDSQLYGHVLAGLDQYACLHHRAFLGISARAVSDEAIHGADSRCPA